MNKKKLLINFILLLLIINLSQAQEIVTTTGGKTTNNNGSITYTIGQTFYNSYKGTNNSIVEGVQQPFEISVVSGITEDHSISLNAIVYPNPATDYLLLKIDGIKIYKLSYQIFNINGKLMKNKLITSNETRISLKNISSNVYILKVLQKEKELKTFRIIKK